MTDDIETGRDVIRQALQARIRKGSSAILSRNLGISNEALLDFAAGRVSLPTSVLKALALVARLHAGDYGVCHECEEEIPEKRLRALPFANRCLTCQESAEHLQLRDRRIGQRRPPFAAVQ